MDDKNYYLANSTEQKVTLVCVRRGAANAVSTVPARMAFHAEEMLSALVGAQEHVCSLRCPSVKKEGEPWTHSPECEAITKAIDNAAGASQ